MADAVKVVCAFTNLRPETSAALDATGHEWDAVDVSGSDEAYYEALAALWAEGDGFILVEHDVVVLPNTIKVLEDCPSEWCSFPTDYVHGPYHGLSCVKFGASMIASHPQAVIRAGELQDSIHPQRHWCRLDAWLQRQFGGSRRCFHVPVLGHVRDYEGKPQPSHGCLGSSTVPRRAQ